LSASSLSHWRRRWRIVRVAPVKYARKAASATIMKREKNNGKQRTTPHPFDHPPCLQSLPICSSFSLSPCSSVHQKNPSRKRQWARGQWRHRRLFKGRDCHVAIANCTTEFSAGSNRGLSSSKGAVCLALPHLEDHVCSLLQPVNRKIATAAST